MVYFEFKGPNRVNNKQFPKLNSFLSLLLFSNFLFEIKENIKTIVNFRLIIDNF